MCKNQKMGSKNDLRLSYGSTTVQFVRTNSNLADFLTREGMLPGDADKF